MLNCKYVSECLEMESGIDVTLYIGQSYDSKHHRNHPKQKDFDRDEMWFINT